MPTGNSKSIVTSLPRNWSLSTASRLALALCLACLMMGARVSAQTVTDLYDFTGNSGDGYEPSAPMLISPSGVLYGTTLYGGLLSCGGTSSIGCGTVFQMAPASGGTWTHTTIYEFKGGKQGSQSYSSLTLGRAGSLYGAVDDGSDGGIYRLTPAGQGQPWNYELLYGFKNQSDGLYPLSPVYLDKAGAIYGATIEGSLSGPGCNPQFGCGEIFQLVPPAHHGGAWTKKALYQFQGTSDGGNPNTLFMDGSGTIYGTTQAGGIFNQSCTYGCGVIFRLVPENGGWTYSVLYQFKGLPGRAPYGNLVHDASGVLYGLVNRSSSGGADIFQLSPPSGQGTRWTLHYIHHYVAVYPADQLAIRNGVLYGSIYGDQDFDAGYLFKIAPPAQSGGKWTYTTLVDFNKVGAGVNPAGVVVGASGEVFATMSGGTYAAGNIVSVGP